MTNRSKPYRSTPDGGEKNLPIQSRCLLHSKLATTLETLHPGDGATNPGGVIMVLVRAADDTGPNASSSPVLAASPMDARRKITSKLAHRSKLESSRLVRTCCFRTGLRTPPRPGNGGPSVRGRAAAPVRTGYERTSSNCPRGKKKGGSPRGAKPTPLVSCRHFGGAFFFVRDVRMWYEVPTGCCVLRRKNTSDR